MAVALYQQVHDALDSRIRSGEYPAGEALPSETRLVEEFGVSLITVRRALHELALEGLVDSRQGLGHFVRDAAAEQLVIGMSSFTSDVAAGRLRVARTLLADEMWEAPGDVATKLCVQQGSLVRRLVRLDCSGGSPFSVDTVMMPPALASAVDTEVAASPVFVHLWQERSGTELTTTNYDIYVQPPSERDREILGIAPEVPVLVTEELVYTSDGHPAMWIESRYRSDRCKLSGTVTLVRRQTHKGAVGE